MYWKQNRDDEIEELKQKIKEVTFPKGEKIPLRNPRYPHPKFIEN
jgi:hypothetical protein